MTYTPEKLAELKAVAEAATPGPWYRKDAEANGTYGIEYIDAVKGDPQREGGYSEIADCSYVRYWEGRRSKNVDSGERRANATHIATFDPPQILALIAEIERLRDAMPRLVNALRCFLEDQRFHVAVGGNPIAVEKMIAEARAAARIVEELGGQKDG